jgi:heat shock protein HslJ
MRSWLMLLLAVVPIVLGLVSAETTRAQSFSSAVWQLDDISGPLTAQVEPSSRYTVQFRSDGTVSIQADCNRASGLWTGGTTSLDVTITLSTPTTCPSGSFGRTFLQALDGATGYSLSGTRLTLPYEANGTTGSMVLVAAPV